MKNFCCFLLLLMILVSLTTADTAQKSESFLDQLSRLD